MPVCPSIWCMTALRQRHFDRINPVGLFALSFLLGPVAAVPYDGLATVRWNCQVSRPTGSMYRGGRRGVEGWVEELEVEGWVEDVEVEGGAPAGVPELHGVGVGHPRLPQGPVAGPARGHVF